MNLTVSAAGAAPVTYEEAQKHRNEGVWVELSKITLRDALEGWLRAISNLNTRAAYRAAMGKFEEAGLIFPEMSLQEFGVCDFEGIVDRIKMHPTWREASKQSRAAAFISFTKWLERRTNGLVHQARPCLSGPHKTFFDVREKCVTPALQRAQWTHWLPFVREIHVKYWLIAVLMLQGGKRVSEVLNLKTDHINYCDRTITFRQLKRGAKEVYTEITYPQHVIGELSKYIGERVGHVFLSRGGIELTRVDVRMAFLKASEKAQMPFPVTPHVLRASCVTYLREQGFSDSDIMGVTGHVTIKMLNAYDKRSIRSNASQKVSLV